MFLNTVLVLLLAEFIGKMFSKCIFCIYACLIGLDVHLLQIKICCYKANFHFVFILLYIMYQLFVCCTVLEEIDN